MSSKSKTSRAKSTAVLSTMVLLGTFAAFTPKTLARYSGGTGEPNDPYQITTVEDLNDIGNHEDDWDKHFILVNDVNLAQYTGTQFNIIGKWFDWNNPNNKPFTGIFDGNNHKIWNFTWRSANRNFIGLFGHVGTGGQIKNLGLENIDVNTINGYCVGGLVGSNGGVITNCYSIGGISGDLYLIGGLIGDNYGTINNCHSSGGVLGNLCTGGSVGRNIWPGTISDCYSTVNVTGTWGSAGDLVGFNESTITNCYSTGRVFGVWDVGGLVGTQQFGKITNCFSTGSVTGTQTVGGLSGVNNGTITNSYSTGRVTGIGDVGGLVGLNRFGRMTNCYSTGSVSGTTLVGGLIGHDSKGIVETSFWDIESSDCNTSAGGEPKTTAEMKTMSTFTEAAWDFVEMWGIGENQTYPYLRFAPAGDLDYDKKVDLFDLAILASHWLEEN